MTSVKAKIVKYIEDNCLPKNHRILIEHDKNLFDEGIVDSAGLISFIAYIETEFNFTIPDEDLLPENFQTINTITEYIKNHVEVVYEQT